MMTTTPAPTTDRQRRLSLITIAIALLAAAVALWLVYGRPASGPAPFTGLVEEGGVFPVASLFGVDNVGAQPDAGHPAPDFTIHLPDGSTTSLAAYRGRPVIVNFWATWCGPCRLEMPDLVRAFEAHQEDGLVVLEVNVAEPHQPVAAFVEEFSMTMPVVIDAHLEVMRAYKTQSLPATFFIDRDGVVQVRWVGFLTPDMLQLHLQKIL